MTSPLSYDADKRGVPSASGTVKPLTTEEILILKVAQLTLNRDFVDTAARILLRGVRPASAAQDLVLRADLEELKRRCDDAAKVEWPKSAPKPEGTPQLSNVVTQKSVPATQPCQGATPSRTDKSDTESALQRALTGGCLLDQSRLAQMIFEDRKLLGLALVELRQELATLTTQAAQARRLAEALKTIVSRFDALPGAEAARTPRLDINTGREALCEASLASDLAREEARKVKETQDVSSRNPNP